MAPHPRRGSPAAGASLVELAVTLAGLAVISGAMLSFFAGASGLDRVQAADDAALEATRDARALLARDVREARRFTVLGPASFTVWLDDEWDGTMGPDEVVTWSITPAGALLRAVGAGAGRVEALGLSTAQSWFHYDQATAALVTRAFVHLVLIVGGPAGGERALDFEVSLRNVP